MTRLLTVDRIDVAYGDFQVLWQASMDVGEGEIVAVLGPNGAGKSTLLNTISGLIRPGAGQITFAGKRLDGLPPLASAVSLGLTVSYIRVAISPRFAFLEVGLSQLVYQVLFSATFFQEAYTGLSITVLCILTLFAVMQYTAKVDWAQAFGGRQKNV